MTGEELFMRDVVKYNQPYTIHIKGNPNVSEEVHEFIALFRKLCIRGGRIPIPVIALASEDDEFPNARTRTASREGCGIQYQALLVKPIATKEALLTCVELCKWTVTDSALCLACHEVRHCLQTRKIVPTCHGKQWMNAWFNTHYQGAFCHMGSLVYKQEAIIEHADRFLPISASRKKRQKKRAGEHDAEATAIACVGCWQMTYSITEVTKLLHS